MSEEDNLNAAYAAWLDRESYYHDRGLYWDRDTWRYEPQYPEDAALGDDQFAPGAMQSGELADTEENFTNWQEF